MSAYIDGLAEAAKNQEPGFPTFKAQMSYIFSGIWEEGRQAGLRDSVTENDNPYRLPQP